MKREQISIKYNFLYNILLTLSTYVASLIVYPYVSRVLGVDHLGVFSFVNKTIDFFTLFSVLGVTTVGIREISSSKNNVKKMSEVFSSLVSLIIISTLVVIAIYLIIIHLVPQFSVYKPMFYIGVSKILFHSLLIEWYFQGLENFRYVTIRNIIIKILYIISVFTFVKSTNDYKIYFILTCLMTVINAIVNWLSSRKTVSFNFCLKKITDYIKPVFSYGTYSILDSLYSTLNYIILGIVCSQTEVGYYYTANNLYLILLGIISALTRVLMPRMCAIIHTGDTGRVNSLIENSFDVILSFCIPLSIFGFAFSPLIVQIVAGSGYEGAIIPLRIMMILVLLNAINQVFIVQIMSSYRMDKPILIGAIFAAAISIILNLFLLKPFGAIGASIVLAVSVLCANIYPIYKLIQSKIVSLPWHVFIAHLKISLPYVLLAIIEIFIPDDAYFGHILVLLSAVGYFYIVRGKKLFLLIKSN